MTWTSNPYPKTQPAGGRFDPEAMHEEAQAATLAGYLECGISIDGSCRFVFSAEPDQATKDALSALVDAHAAIPLPAMDLDAVLRDVSTGKILGARAPRTSLPILQRGINVHDGEVYFSNTKTAAVTFPSPFSKVPRIHLTPADSSTAPHWKADATVSGFVIRCKTRWSGSVEWTAQERNGDG